jgi:predicted acyltransferase
MTVAPHQRLDSLDVFRGLTIAAMILVSTPGTWTAVYAPLDHAAWDGWTPTDLVFPFLLFAMGAAVPFALARRRHAAVPVRRHVLRRAAILFALGLVLNAIESSRPLDWQTFRIPGVLQRIALVYLAITWITETMTWRAQLACAASLLTGYWVLLTMVPAGGAGPGVLTPSGNLASLVDRMVFRRHLLTPLYDPEGLLSTLPAIATALGGVFAGDWLKGRRDAHPSVRLWAAGAAATVVAVAWSRVFPINKTLWTSSFALLSAGFAAQALALCHWVVDVKHWRRGTWPLVAFGRNPLAAYFLSVGGDSILTRWTVHGASMKSIVYDLLFASWIAPRFGAQAASLGYAVAYVVVWGALLSEMHRRRIFIAI